MIRPPLPLPEPLRQFSLGQKTPLPPPPKAGTENLAAVLAMGLAEGAALASVLMPLMPWGGASGAGVHPHDRGEDNGQGPPDITMVLSRCRAAQQRVSGQTSEALYIPSVLCPFPFKVPPPA